MIEEEKVIVESRSFLKILDMAKAAAVSDAPVLIYGESGTGKEVIADYIHKTSLRAAQKIIKINCVALPENLFESELFGYEAHAFTGAQKQKKGIFEIADKGTILLDEIGEVPLSLQPKLLRVLQEKEILRIGGHIPIKVDFRVISASNKNLKTLVHKGLFREDLYYRLNVIEISVPPLRERREDIGPLLDYFMKLYSEKYSKKITGFEPGALDCLQNYPWHGNVRELKNLIERLVIFENKEFIGTEFFPDDLCVKARTCQNKACKSNFNVSGDIKAPGIMDTIEKQIIENALAESRGNQKLAAEKIGMHRNTIKKKIEEYNINLSDIKKRF